MKTREKKITAVISVLRKSLGNEQISEESIATAIIEKVYLNLRSWNDKNVIMLTIKLLQKVIGRFRNSPTAHMVAQSVLRSHQQNEFLFSQIPNNFEIRYEFYSAVYEILTDFDQYENLTSQLFKNYNVQITNLANYHDDPKKIRANFLGFMSDWKGIVDSIQKSVHFVQFWEWLTQHFYLIEEVLLHALPQDTEVLVATLNFLCSLTMQKYKRISFNASSVSGIMLFQKLMLLIKKFSKEFMRSSEDNFQDIYESRYKVAGLVMRMYQQMLSGEYVKYGQLIVFGDTCVRDALYGVIDLIESCELKNLVYFPDISKEYWSLCKVLFRQQLHILIADHPRVFNFLFNSFTQSLDTTGLDKDYYNSCTTLVIIFEKVAEFRKHDTKTYNLFRKYLEANGELMYRITTLLFRGLFFHSEIRKDLSSLDFPESICNAIYNIIVPYPQVWNLYFEELRDCQSLDHQRQMVEQLRIAMSNLYSKNIFDPAQTHTTAGVSKQIFTEQMRQFRSSCLNALTDPHS